MAKKKRTRGRVSKLTRISKPAKIGPVDGEAIKARRKALGLTLADAAKRAGWASEIQWWDVENKPERDPRISTMEKVAKVLGCKVDDLLRK